MSIDDEMLAVGRAMIPTAILLLLMDEPDYGYSLVARLKEAGFWHVQAGSVYTQIRSMEGRGLLSSTWDSSHPGPPRKILSVTDLGAVAAGRQKQQIEDSILCFSKLSPGGHGGRNE